MTVDPPHSARFENAAHALRRALPWAVAAAAVLTLSGCGFLGYGKSETYVEPQPKPEVTSKSPLPGPKDWDGRADTAEEPPAAVNVFGEFDGIASRATTAGSENSFQQHTASDEGYDADVVVDPTGKWLAFSSTRHSTKADIYLQRVDGASVIQLTSDAADDVQPSFSPDGQKIAFASSRAGNWDIYVMDLDGKNIELVTGTAAQEIHPSFSSDGTRVVYCALSQRSDQWELWTIDLTSHERKMIGHGLFPTWSPRKDVDRIAFQRARQRGSRWFSIWTMDLNGGEPHRLTEVAVSSNAAVVSPAWSPDGQRLAFTTILQPTRAAADPNRPSAPGRRDIWVASADGSNRQRLTEGLGTNLGPTWAADNRIYFISDRSGHENVWSVKIEAAKTATAGAGNDPATH